MPLHPRFETEDLKIRQNHTFVLDEDVVEIYDTSRGFGNVLLETIEAPFPFGCQNASEYYTELFRKALRMEDDISFLGYVDENFNEIFPEDP